MAENIDPVSRPARPAGSTTPTAMAITPAVVPVSQSQTQEAVPKAKAPKKGILAGRGT